MTFNMQEQAGRSAQWQRVLINMCFNMGIDRLLGFQRMIVAIIAERWDEAAREMLDSTWAHQVGARADRLARMMETGAELSTT